MKRLSFSRLTKKQWLIVGVLAAVLLTSIVGAVVITKERAQQEALRQDKAKFEQLDAKMQKIFTEFKKVAPEAQWMYVKSCYYAKTKFPDESSRPQGCEIKIRSSSATNQPYEEFQQVLRSHDFAVGDPVYLKDINGYGSSMEKDGVICDLISASKDMDKFYQGTFSCRSSALKSYY